MAVEIYLIRHGETEFNRAGRYQGQQDSALTEKGRGQARRNGRRLKELIGDAAAFDFVASPLGRTVTTAQIICEELGFDPTAVRTDARLMEIAFGDWEGMTREEIDARWPGAWQRRRENRWHHAMPNGENYAMVADRLQAWLDEVEGRTIAVAHGAVGRVLRGLYAGLSQQEVLDLDEPQDEFFRLAEGTITRL